MERNRKKQSVNCLLALGVCLFVTACFPWNIKGAEQELYVAGMPKESPLEYYDQEAQTYQGVLAELLQQAAEDSGLTLTYLEPYNADHRLELGRNVQVDVLWTYDLSEDQLEEAGLTVGEPVLTYQEGGETMTVALAYSKSVSEEVKQQLETSLNSIDQSRVSSLLYEYAQKGTAEDQESRWYRWGVIALILLVFGSSSFFAYRLSKRKQEMFELATRDDITGGTNYGVWKLNYRKIIRPENREHYAIIYLNVGAETIRHIYGYQEGSYLVQITYRHCMDAIHPEYEGVSRFNEFFFVMYLQYESVEELIGRLRNIYDRLKDQTIEDKKRFFPENNAGIYCLNTIDEDVIKAVQYSEVAMEYGRNHYLDVAVYNRDIEHEVVRNYAMEHEAVHGLIRQEFLMYLQPVVDINTGEILGAEALVRWQNPGRGMLMPAEFLEVMKKKQLIGKMNMDIFRQGCAFIQNQQNKGRKVTLLFNFTVENVGDSQFVEQVNAIASQYEIDRSQLYLQLNQLVEMSSAESFKETIQKLRKSGYNICLSGLELDSIFFEYLECGVNAIKLRHDLIRHVNKPEGQKVIKNLVGFLGELGLGVVCVGIENQEQAEFMKNVGCKYASGFYYYYPVSQNAFDGLFEKEN